MLTGHTSIQWLAGNLDVRPLVQQISCHPSVWNRHSARRAGYSPHLTLDDIWVRYNAIENLTSAQAFNEPHESVWYSVVEEIPAVKTLVFDVMRWVQGERLGGVLITRIPPRGRCDPHIDEGWHARYYEKFAVQLAANEKQSFCFEDAQLVTRPGDLYTFDNSRLHWVENPSDEARMTLIICIRRS